MLKVKDVLILMENSTKVDMTQLRQRKANECLSYISVLTCSNSLMDIFYFENWQMFEIIKFAVYIRFSLCTLL
jgi:hypothetical protein